MKLAPSILSADFSALGEAVAAAEAGGAHLVHIDVMDGRFVPNISFGAVVMKSLAGKTRLPFDVHLMIEEPDRYLGEFVTEQTEFITVHQEACIHLHRTVQHIREYGVKAGVAINPATPVGMLREILPCVDLVTVMSVNPGFGGQALIPGTLEKARQLRELKKKHGYAFEVELDGGVTEGNIAEALEAGTDIAVAGSAVFGGPDIVSRCRRLLEAAGR